MSQELSAKLEAKLSAIIDGARKVENVTPAYAKVGKDVAGFLAMFLADEKAKRADGVKLVQERLSAAGLYGNVTRYLKCHALVTVAPDAENLPISGVIALAPMVTVGTDGECRTAGRYTVKDVTRIVSLAMEKRWNAKRLSSEVKSIRQGYITPEEERNAKIRDRERKAEKLRSILEKCKPETLSAIISASKKLQAKLSAILNPEPAKEPAKDDASKAAA